MVPIASVENAVVERLRQAMPYAVSIGLYKGELDGGSPALPDALPAAWVDFRGTVASRPLDTAGTFWRTELTLTTLVAAAERHDQGETAGSYRMLNDVLGALIPCDFGLQGVTRMKPGAIRALPVSGNAGGISAYAQDWSVACDYALPASQDEAPLKDVALAYWLGPSPDMSVPPASEDRVRLQGA